MSYKIAAALALSFGLATSALAQTGTGSGENASPGTSSAKTMSNLPSTWEGPIGEAFFSDSAAGTLRSDEEIRTNWGSLSADQQAQVRTDCESHMAANNTDTSVQTSSTTDNTTATGSGSEGEEGPGTLTTAMNDLCADIGGM